MAPSSPSVTAPHMERLLFANQYLRSSDTVFKQSGVNYTRHGCVHYIYRYYVTPVID